MAKIGKFYRYGPNEYFVVERITRECFGGGKQINLRLGIVDKSPAKFSAKPDFNVFGEIPEPLFDRVAEEIK